MTEEFLYHVWKFRLLSSNVLKTTEGEEVEILKPGLRNNDSGPDFFNARIRIGKTEWAGNVEIDPKSSDWILHKHHLNDAFSKIILHVVFHHDKNVHHTFPVVELKNFIAPALIDKYESIIHSPTKIPCAAQIGNVDEITVNTWLDRLLIERLEQKTKSILDFLEKNKFNWEETFYFLLSRSFGFKTNAVPFEMLAKSIPLQVFAKHKNNRSQIEALLFGQAGFLNEDFTDEYFQSLKKEYSFLHKKFSLSSLEKSLWKFSKLRPPNFPTLRLAQFAGLIYNSSHLFSKIIECKKVSELKTLFACEVSDYWKSHYLFVKKSEKVKYRFGESSAENIIINTVVPLVFLYGKIKENEKTKAKALRWLEEIRPENNAIIREWISCGIKPDDAYQSQALLELRNNYCSQKKCLQCAIGLKILNRL